MSHSPILRLPPLEQGSQSWSWGIGQHGCKLTCSLFPHKAHINGIRASDQLERWHGERDTSMLLSFEDYFAKGCNQQLKIIRVSIYASVWSKTYCRSVSESQERFKTQRCVALSQYLKLFMLL